MSRRKQSNPKPLKRKTEDSLEEIAELLHLPTDLFSVRDPQDDVHEYTLYSKRRLREGLSFGPYAGQVIQGTEGEEDEEATRDHVIETKDECGNKVRFSLSDKVGGWLKLLRPATSYDTFNVSLLHNEKIIWCTITSDIEPDTELVVSCKPYEGDTTPLLRKHIEPRLHTKHLLRKHKANRTRCRDGHVDDVRNRKQDGFPEVSENNAEDMKQDRKRFKEGTSPHRIDENLPHCNGDYSKEIKCDPSSPISPNSAPSPSISASDVNNDVEPNVSSTNAAPYLNGCHYPPAFPYGLNSVVESDGFFKCENCDVTFNSRRILEAHQSYYCSERQSSMVVNSDTDTDEASAQPKSVPTTNNTGSPRSDEGEMQSSKEVTPSKRHIEQTVRQHSHEEHTPVPHKQARLNPSVQIQRTARVYKCLYCNYTTDKKASLTRHVRMHGSSPNSEGNSEMHLPTPPMARYCANCDIQFASYKNYQVHKQFYCNTRHVHKSVNASSSPPSHHGCSGQPRSPEGNSGSEPVKNPSTSSGANNNMVLNQPLYAAISTSPLILVPCSYVAGGGLSPAAGLIPAGNIIIPSNSVATPDGGSESHHQGANVIPTFTVMSSSSGDLPALSPTTANEHNRDDVQKPVKSPTKVTKVPKPEPEKSPKEESIREEPEKPLDLSFRKRERKSSSEVIPAHSLSVSSCSSTSSDDISLSVTSNTPMPLLPIITPSLDVAVMSRGPLPIQQGSVIVDPVTPVLAPPPQVLVKQGTSKCKECNIVFYKHENYLVHKNLYCASRLQKTQRDSVSPERGKEEETAEKEDSGRVQSKSPVSSPRRSTNSRTPPTQDGGSDSLESHSPPSQQAVFQFYCMACGIKFTSIDNLKAHQTYYCPKRDLSHLAQTPMGLLPTSFSRMNHHQEFKCGKCKNLYPSEETLRQHPCVVQRKCPYCDVYCPTLSAAQRHLVTHTGIKSFRCSLCGYKGHTLRGMRTHIRIHLDKNSTTPEEAYILCMDEGGAEIGCASRKSNAALRVNSDRIKSVIATEPPAAPEIPNPLHPIEVLKGEDPVVTGDATHWCQICGYSSSYKGNVVRHVKLVHKELVSSQSMSNVVNSRPMVEPPTKACESLESSPSRLIQLPSVTQQDLSNHAADLSNSSSSLDVKPAINGISSAKVDNDASKSPTVMLKTEAVSPPLPSSAGSSSPKETDSQEQPLSSKTGAKYCKFCDISFNYLSNFIAHKKFYCTPRLGELVSQESTSAQSVQ